jgi:hypothetical protein
MAIYAHLDLPGILGQAGGGASRENACTRVVPFTLYNLPRSPCMMINHKPPKNEDPSERPDTPNEGTDANHVRQPHAYSMDIPGTRSVTLTLLTADVILAQMTHGSSSPDRPISSGQDLVSP